MVVVIYLLFDLLIFIFVIVCLNNNFCGILFCKIIICWVFILVFVLKKLLILNNMCNFLVVLIYNWFDVLNLMVLIFFWGRLFWLSFFLILLKVFVEVLKLIILLFVVVIKIFFFWLILIVLNVCFFKGLINFEIFIFWNCGDELYFSIVLFISDCIIYKLLLWLNFDLNNLIFVLLFVGGGIIVFFKLLLVLLYRIIGVWFFIFKSFLI